jgi:hypothetical protein
MRIEPPNFLGCLPHFYQTVSMAVCNINLLSALLLMTIAQVRDAWVPFHNAAAQPATSPVINYAQDTWDDADMEPVISWLEDHVKSRRSKTSL